MINRCAVGSEVTRAPRLFTRLAVAAMLPFPRSWRHNLVDLAPSASAQRRPPLDNLSNDLLGARRILSILRKVIEGMKPYTRR